MGWMMPEFDSEYFWVVLCKNHLYHNLRNRSAGHAILLGETDAFSPPPPLKAPFGVRCDDCGREYFYHPKEVLRFETEPPSSFAAHPQFADFGQA